MRTGPADITAGLRPGATNSLVDVPDVAVGHATRHGDGWLSGVTVVLAPAAGAVAGVDVRGGAPGTRETDLLDPRNMVERVHAVVLSGGSAFGLAAADGVMRALAADGVGLAVGDSGAIVPIVPAAVIFDLGRGGSRNARPDAEMGALAYAAARSPAGLRAVPMGVVGAGTGATAGGLKGGVGSASVSLPDGTTVAALSVVNAVGSTVDPMSGQLYATRFGLAGEFDALAMLAATDDPNLQSPNVPGAATTLAVLATDATLTKAQCAKVAGVAHDGMARAIRPVHTMFDGDTVFTLATCARVAPDPATMHLLLTVAADVLTRAIGHAMLAAQTIETPAGRWRSYRDTVGATISGQGSAGPAHERTDPAGKPTVG